MTENNKSIGLNELVDYKPKTYSPLMKNIMRFLWKCAGADPEILKYSPYSDHIKSAGIGGVVLATSVMASLAMGFAMHSIFGVDVNGVHEGNWFITVPVGIVWGLIIFNLDRFIVTTAKGDGTEKITWGEWGSMLPRLVMAILIGLCISAPLETYIFKKEIKREWDEVKTQMALKARFDINNELNNDGDLISLSNTTYGDSLTYQISKKQYDSIISYQITVQRCDNDPCSNHQKTIDFKKALEIQMNNASKSYIQDTSNLRKYKNIRSTKSQSVSDSVKSLEPGFLDQIMMLERLSGEGKKINQYDPNTGDKIKNKTGDEQLNEIYGSAFWPIWLVRLLFMIIEIAPVIFKFMIWKSSYDYMQDNVAQILEAKQGISLEHIVDENNNMHKVKENYNARRIVEVSKRQNELEKENAIHAITLYAEKEREEMEKNPEKFIKSQDENTSNSPDDSSKQNQTT